MSDLIQNIKDFIEIEKNITKYNDILNKLKNKKNEVETNIEKYFVNKESKEIKLSNGYSLVYQQNKNPPSISIKLLTEVLQQSIKNENLINTVLEHLKRKRIDETKYKNIIKYKKN